MKPWSLNKLKLWPKDLNEETVTFLLQLWHQNVKQAKRYENQERQLYGFSSFVWKMADGG